MKSNKKILIDGLLPLPKDERDFSHFQTFGCPAVNDLPTRDFLVSVPLELKDQDINYQSDFCAAYGASELAEFEDQVIFCPEWTFAFAKYLLSLKSGPQVISQFGLNLRDVCSSALESNKGGFLPRFDDPFKCNTEDRPARDFIATYSNWPAYLRNIAQKYAKAAYYAVDGPHDTFDNFRACLWKNLSERRGILTGCYWRTSWNYLADGIVPKLYEQGGTAHAFNFIGQKTINGEIHLVAQLSDGDDFGDHGLFYFSRETVNKEFSIFGAYTFQDKLPTDLSTSNGVTLEKINKFSPLYIFKVISNLFKKI